MAKRKVRGTERDLNRADLKALERRAISARVGGAAATPAAAPLSSAPLVTSRPTSAPADGRRGVLPPRLNRSLLAAPTISREQEIAFIQADLKRMTWLAIVMIILIIALTFLVPMLVR